jgi:nicotinamide-nucleotide amidase
MSSPSLENIARFMAGQSLVLTTAESCTAGLIAAHLADVPGAGQLLESACVTYSPEAKQRLLGVSAETIRNFNLTSEQVASEMAQGALQGSPASLAIANTGVTDDTDPAIPAGTQCFAWAFATRAGHAQKIFTETRRFAGARNEIREQAAHYALSRISHYHAAFCGECAPEGARAVLSPRAADAESS